MSTNLEEIQRQVDQKLPAMTRVVEEVTRVVVGQRNLIDRLLVAMLSDGHVLVEGVPGLAKTTAINALAKTLDAGFQRIQFTPDLLPADIIGTQIYSPKDGSFTSKKGPVFTNLLLADEINRAPAKVQSALLEAMQEGQVTIAEKTYPLPKPFFVMATQNPIEQEGTYPLPEAQVDRFMLKVRVEYPAMDDEIRIMKQEGTKRAEKISAVLSPEALVELKNLVSGIFVDDKLYDYVARVVFATRYPEKHGLGDLKSMISFGASPRASICLIQAARAHAFLQGRAYVTPQDIKTIGMDVLRHRVMVSYEAEAQDLTSESVVTKIFDKVDVP